MADPKPSSRAPQSARPLVPTVEPDVSLSASKADRAVAFVNARALRISGALLEIGEYLFREFFTGDPALVSSRDPSRMATFRELAERKDLLVGFVTLWRAVQLAVQNRWLARVAPAGALTTSHAIELLPVRDVATKRALAIRAAQGGWSTRRLREEVRRVMPAPEPRSPAADRVRRARKTLRDTDRLALQGILAPGRVRELSSSQVRSLEPPLRDAVRSLTRALAALEAHPLRR